MQKYAEQSSLVTGSQDSFLSMSTRLSQQTFRAHQFQPQPDDISTENSHNKLRKISKKHRSLHLFQHSGKQLVQYITMELALPNTSSAARSRTTKTDSEQAQTTKPHEENEVFGVVTGCPAVSLGPLPGCRIRAPARTDGTSEPNETCLVTAYNIPNLTDANPIISQTRKT